MTCGINNSQDDQVVEKCQDEANKRFSRPISSYNLESRGSNMGFKSWLLSIFTLPDERILDSSGNDALHYLRFQRHIICFLLIVTVISIGVILPINLQGTFNPNIKANYYSRYDSHNSINTLIQEPWKIFNYHRQLWLILTLINLPTAITCGHMY